MIGMKMKNKSLGLLLMLVSALFSCANDISEKEMVTQEVITLPYYHTPDFQPIWESDQKDTLHMVPAFDLVDQNGNQVTKESFKNSIYVANFFFTNCGGICPKMMRNMAYLQDHSSKDIKFISHSVLPEQDSIAQLKTYSNNFGVDDYRWHLVTGNRADVYDLARKGYFTEESIGYNKDSTEFLHTEHFMLVDQAGHLRGIYNGTLKLEMDRILEDIQLLTD